MKSSLQKRGISLAVLVTMALLPAVAMATPPDPPDMGTVAFPVDLTSIATAVSVAGGLLLLAYFGIKVGFSVAKSLMERARRSI